MLQFARLAAIAMLAVPCSAVGQAEYVNPMIGSEGLGRVFIGPSAPFGMVKPGPDCTEKYNSGWTPMPEVVTGFSQVHVSGTGGGPKYGNILIQPFCSGLSLMQPSVRTSEHAELGYYTTTYKNGITTEITTAERASHYTISYPADSTRSLLIDAGFFLGESPVPNAREAQQFVGSEVQIVSDHEVCGYSRISGGWNNGKAYTVYFHLSADCPFISAQTWKNGRLTSAKSQYDSGEKTGALVRFAKGADKVGVKIGISFVSALKARENLEASIGGNSFKETRRQLTDKWNSYLRRIRISAKANIATKQMFYTALYHTMLMPVDRTGDNPGWNSSQPYYDDYYAIWDTYRTSTPLLTLIAPERETEIVNSLLNIYEHDGYMPDARSGNSNGRTQGGSNGEIVIADALAKGLTGIDYHLALKAMIKDATIPPGGNEEAEGRGALAPYLEKGYIPYGYPRAGTRTVEYSFCDWAIAMVAKELGDEATYRKYIRQSESWKNLWNADCRHDGVSGFIMPRDNDGHWLMQLPFGHSRNYKATFTYPPSTSYEGPWYVAWWDCFFYEASSWEYSLSIPHEVEGLIEKCGGRDEFLRRLETFFEHGYYNVANEPSFLTPCLYHWIGRPDLTSQRVADIISRHYSNKPDGIPGNDDSGAMSSWLAFHMMGLYPNAGHDYYLIHTPMVDTTTVSLSNGRSFSIVAKNLSRKNRYIVRAELNGKPYDINTISHSNIVNGGTLTLVMGRKPASWGTQMTTSAKEQILSAGKSFFPSRKSFFPSRKTITSKGQSESMPTIAPLPTKEVDTTIVPAYQYTYSLHGQTRRFKVGFRHTAEGLQIGWSIVRNLKTWHGNYYMNLDVSTHSRRMSFEQPTDGNDVHLESEVFGIVSTDVLNELKEKKLTRFNDTTFRLVGFESTPDGERLVHAIDTEEGAEMWILDNESLPIVWKYINNPVEINWQVNKL